MRESEMAKKGKGPIYGQFIPLGARIRFKTQRSRERRRWLEARHARNPRCHYCGNITELKPSSFEMSPECKPGSMHATLDHRVPSAQGGADHAANWCLSCFTCNNLKGDMAEQDYKEMLRIEGVID